MSPLAKVPDPELSRIEFVKEFTSLSRSNYLKKVYTRSLWISPHVDKV